MQKAACTILLIAAVFLGIFCNFPTEPPQQVIRATRGMKLIPGGTFTMGSSDSIEDIGAQPLHEVTVDSFFMDSVEVTQMMYEDFMGFNPTFNTHSNGTSLYPYYPVDSLSWYDAVLFANERSKREHLDTVYSYSAALKILTLGNIGDTIAIRCTSMTDLFIDYSKKGYRLPTEAEWEYACRAGSTTAQYWGDVQNDDTVANYAWYDYNASKHLNLVAWKLPNAWGLYDMIGNVWEWCNDWYEEGYSNAAAVNPVGPASGTERVVRGGGSSTFILPGSASRDKDMPGNYRSSRGFRCVLPK